MDARPKPLHIAAALAIAVALAAVAIFGAGRDAPEQEGAPAELPDTLTKLQETAGKPPVPEASFVDGEGREVKLSDFRGRFVVLNLWAKWCPPCVYELPALARAQARLPREKIAIVAVDLENNERAEVLEFLRAHGAQDLTPYVDRDLDMMRAFKAYGLPLTVIIDPEGREVARAFGPEKWDGREALAYLRGLIAERDQRVGTGTSPR
ncbi:MAG: TlpA family protein disulfide reductase [Alphaproteobacteria bacterium]